MKKHLCMAILFFLLPAAYSANLKPVNLTTVPYVDLSRYAGTWYQIAKNPLVFEGVCACSQQKLAPTDDGRISVYNSCNDQAVDGPIRDISGFATVDDPVSNARLTVDFNLPRKGAYWIIGLDQEYRYAVVSDPSKMSLYILSKTPFLSSELYNEALEKAASQVDTSKLTLTEHKDCVYP